MASASSMSSTRRPRLFTAVCVGATSFVALSVISSVVMLRRSADRLVVQADSAVTLGLARSLDRIRSLTGILTWLGVVAVVLLVVLTVQTVRLARRNS